MGKAYLVQEGVLENTINVFLVNQETTFSTELKNEEKPLTGATVRFEYWSGTGKHTFVDAKESDQGVYSASTTLTTAGEYHLKVHVEKGEEIHDHKETIIKIQ